MKINEGVEQLTLFDQDIWCGKTCQGHSAPQAEKISARSSKKPAELQTAPFLYLDLRPGGGNLLGPSWDLNSPSLGEYWMLNNVKLHIIGLM